MRALGVPFLIAASLMGVQSRPAASAELPNIVYILADDLGYGDVRSFNPEGKIPTPNIDRLAEAGMRFTDAHSGSAVCTPTRYGLLTGRYSWRTRLQSGVCWGYSPPLIDSKRLTVASLLKQQGYRTSCVGKWHLGLGWTLKDPSHQYGDRKDEHWDNIDFSGPIRGGPCDLGFDEFFGIPASLDMHPYVYVRDDRVTSVPSRIIPSSEDTGPFGGMRFWREGPIGDDFRLIEVLDQLTEEASDFISSQTSDVPFFLYFPLTAPHKPIIPNEKFQGKSGLNPWGDFVMQVDWTVGRVMGALEEQGFADNTLIIVTSDNGATLGADFPALISKGHDPSYIYRGQKADVYDAGHRVAFAARWPTVIEPSTTCSETICLTDLLATVAEIVGVTLPADAGQDSVSILPLMKQPASGPVREAIVHHSVNGSFAIRKGRWKLLLCPGSGGWSHPTPDEAWPSDLPRIQLYDLAEDPAEKNNVCLEHPAMVEQLQHLLQKYVREGRSTPGPMQNNDVEIQLTKGSHYARGR